MMPDKPGAAARHVFVYGTLRRGGSNDIARFAPAPVPVGRALIAGTLYDLGPYPGARLGGAGVIHGEVYRITPALEVQLDLLEQVRPDDSGEYIKRELPVTLQGSEGEAQCLSCLVYEIHADRIAQPRPVIASGDWFDKR